MLRIMGLLALSLCTCALLMAAAPFEPLPADSPVHANVETYAAHGLLGELTPQTELSRLEAALLVRRALEAYAERLLAGEPSDPALEQLLSADSMELAAELALLGSRLPAFPAAIAGSHAAPSLEPLAPLTTEPCPDCGEPVGECAEDGAEETACDEPELSITPYGDLALQLRAGRVAIAGGGNLDTSDLTLYWGEAGVEAEYGNLRGAASVLLSTDDADAGLHEAYVEWNDAENGWAVRGGRLVQPLGLRDTVFPTYSAASDLVYTTANTIGGSLSSGNATFSAHAFNPQVEVTGQNDTLSDYVINLELTNASYATPDHYRISAGMTSHVAAGDIRLAGDGPLADRTAAGSLLGEYVWNCGRHRAVVEYAWAFDAFDAADLDADGDGAGDKPSALNLEYIHTDSGGREFGVRHERTSEFSDYARERWAVMHGRRLNDYATFRVELSRGEYGDFSSVNAEHDTQLNAEVRIIF